jgi:hypothetical protein
MAWHIIDHCCVNDVSTKNMTQLTLFEAMAQHLLLAARLSYTINMDLMTDVR